ESEPSQEGRLPSRQSVGWPAMVTAMSVSAKTRAPPSRKVSGGVGTDGDSAQPASAPTATSEDRALLIEGIPLFRRGTKRLVRRPAQGADWSGADSRDRTRCRTRTPSP